MPPAQEQDLRGAGSPLVGRASVLLTADSPTIAAIPRCSGVALSSGQLESSNELPTVEQRLLKEAAN